MPEVAIHVSLDLGGGVSSASHRARLAAKWAKRIGKTLRHGTPASQRIQNEPIRDGIEC
jgi:hypothetical protein